MTRLELLWSDLRNSFWFVPSLIFAASIVLALTLIEIDSSHARPWIERWPRVFGSGAAGARIMLSTIAGSMMTVVGVTFSMTLVTLALASNQYTSRILRNFMGDRITQIALGVFGGIFIYCLIVLRTIRGGDEDYVPSLAVFFGVVLAIAGTAILIFFIHHIASAIQASSVIESVAKETLSSIDRQYEERQAREEHPAGKEGPRPATVPTAGGRRVPSAHIGYIQSIDVAALVRLAHRNDAVVHIERGVGDFVVRGSTLSSTSAVGTLPETFADDVEAAFVIHRFRTIEQDVGFGIRQIVDIALRALSPGVNDTTTGVMCVDYLSAILAHLVNRTFPPREHYCEGTVRVVTTEQSFECMLRGAFDQIRASARGNLAVLTRMLDALRAVGAVTRGVDCRRALLQYVASMQESIGGLATEDERARFRDVFGSTQRVLSDSTGGIATAIN